MVNWEEYVEQQLVSSSLQGEVEPEEVVMLGLMGFDAE